MDYVLKPWSPGKLFAHAVLPGLANLLFFIPLALLLDGTGYPLMVALFVAILLGEVPASWFLMWRAAREEGQELSRQFVMPWRTLVPRLKLVLTGIFLALAGMFIVFGLASRIEPVLISAFFSWIPDSFILRAGPEAMIQSSRAGRIATWLLAGVVGAGIGGVTQEIYHRGFLLPRAAHMGWRSVPFHALGFAVVHMAAPWGWPFFFLVAVVWGTFVYRWRTIRVGLIGHIGMLLIGWLGMTALVFGLTPP